MKIRANANMKKTLGAVLERFGDRLHRWGHRMRLGKSEGGIAARVRALKEFWFVADTPLYIDADLVSALFDSVFRPEFEVASRTLSKGVSKSEEDAFELALGGEASVPTVFKLSATGKAAEKRGASITEAASTVEQAVNSPGTRLEKLLNVYVYSYPERILWIKADLVSGADFRMPDVTLSWKEIEALLDTPGIRPIVVLDLAPGTKALPMFAELTNGQDVELYKHFKEQLPETSRESVPVYPTVGAPDYQHKAKEYWRAFHSVFDSAVAMRTVEKSTKGGSARIDWIDFRLVGFTPDDTVVPIHMHISPKGRYSTGTFAYQLIRRSEKYGIRVIGTLKKGADINVLAIYER